MTTATFHVIVKRHRSLISSHYTNGSCEIPVSFLNDSIAQLVEHNTFNVRVASSNLAGITINNSCEVLINYRFSYIDIIFECTNTCCEISVSVWPHSSMVRAADS